MINQKLARPTFIAGPDDELATADVYQQSSTEAINSIKDESSSIATSLGAADSLRGGKSMLSGMAGAMASAQKIGGLAGSNPLARLTQTNGALGSAMRNLPGDLKSTMIGAVLSGAGLKSGLSMTIGGITQTLKGGVSSLKAAAIGGLINAVNGAAGAVINDIKAKVGSIVGAGLAAVNSGISGAFGAVAGGISDKGLLGAVAGGMLNTCAAKGDFLSIQSMANVLPAGTMTMLNPNIISDVACRYQLPTTGASPSSLFGDVASTFGAITPDWMSATRQTSTGPEAIASIVNIQSASPDFLGMMEAGVKAAPAPPVDHQLLLTAPSFPPTDVNAELLQQYPSIVNVGSSAPPASPPVTDPRTIQSVATTEKSQTYDQLVKQIDVLLDKIRICYIGNDVLEGKIEDLERDLKAEQDLGHDGALVQKMKEDLQAMRDDLKARRDQIIEWRAEVGRLKVLRDNATG